MKRKHQIELILGILMVLLAGLTLTRCGSGVGPGYDASANSVKF